MELKEILNFVVGLVGGGVFVGVVIKVRSSKKVDKSKDSNKIKSLNQQAISNGNIYQSGRDTNVK